MENVAKEISESLARRGHQVKVFNSDIGRNKDKLTSTKNGLLISGATNKSIF